MRAFALLLLLLDAIKDQGLPPLKAQPAAELFAMPPNPVRWYIDQILSAGGVHLIIGPAMAGKTRLLYRLAAALASGLDFLGFKNHAGPVKVLYIDHEHGQDNRRLRLHEFLTEGTVPKNLSIYGKPLPKINIVADRDRFLELCAQYDVIILDNVVSTPGFYRDMKDNVEAAKTMELIDSAMTASGGAFLLVAHPPKSFVRDLHKMGLEELEDLPEEVWTVAASGASAVFNLADIRMLLLSDVRNRHAHLGYKLLFVGGKSVDETTSIPLVLTKKRGLELRARHGPRGSERFTVATDDGAVAELKLRKPWQEEPK